MHVPKIDKSQIQSLIRSLVMRGNTNMPSLDASAYANGASRAGIEDVVSNRIIERKPQERNLGQEAKVAQAIMVAQSPANNFSVPKVELPDGSLAKISAPVVDPTQGGTGMRVPAMGTGISDSFVPTSLDGSVEPDAIGAPPALPLEEMAYAAAKSKRRAKLSEIESLRNATGKSFDKHKDKWYYNTLKGLVSGAARAASDSNADPRESLSDMAGRIFGGGVAGAAANTVSPHMDERANRDVEVGKREAQVEELNRQIGVYQRERAQDAVMENYDSLAEDRKENRRLQGEKVTNDKLAKDNKNYVSNMQAELSPYNKAPLWNATTPEAQAYKERIFAKYGITLPDKDGKTNVKFIQNNDTGEMEQYVYSDGGNAPQSVRPVTVMKDGKEIPLSFTSKERLAAEAVAVKETGATQRNNADNATTERIAAANRAAQIKLKELESTVGKSEALVRAMTSWTNARITATGKSPSPEETEAQKAAFAAMLN